MTAFLAGLLAEFWQPIVAGAVALIGAAGLYLKGRGDARRKAETEDLRNANEIRRQGADARAGAAVGPDRLRGDDGWRRD